MCARMCVCVCACVRACVCGTKIPKGKHLGKGNASMWAMMLGTGVCGISGQSKECVCDVDVVTWLWWHKWQTT